jgi:hypothetical protein
MLPDPVLITGFRSACLHQWQPEGQHLAIISPRYAFTKVGVDGAPASPGVYYLYRPDGLIYIGSSETSIRSRLQRHQSGAEGYCTAQATAFTYELCANAKQRESQELDDCKRTHGRLPPCNEKHT